MAEELKGLIEKIQEEGIKVAQEKAEAIDSEARLAAAATINKAEERAKKILEETEGRVARLEENSRASLKQSARDIILTLKKEIDNTLTKIVSSHVHKALDSAELVRMITALVKDCKHDGKSGIVITLKKEDMEKIEKGLLAELGSELKKGITLKPSDEIRKGFIISYDSGKSHFDFTDKAIAEYIASYLRPKLGELLKEAV